ncbi:hypothetical protein BJ878DRAFT_424674 [Calycina marina]|uniref:DUF8032 domain-containing protein n=1 Tax=Calycina marina TaxID=1763456 RepID=A0A9P7YZS5_9HELO|nr:hypothetical protein BJ878DRAFT_424674 [Calycina marina]
MQHHPHHTQQGPPPIHRQQPRPSSIVHQHQPPPGPPQHSSTYPSSHGVPPYLQQSAPSPAAHHPYYSQHQSSYSTSSTPGPYSSAETPTDTMAAASIGRPYAPNIYHAPQSNSPASVASPSTHDPHRSMYGAQHQQPQQMYYTAGPPQQQQYPPPMTTQPAPPPYAHPPPQQHQPQQHQQSMASQPNLLMSHQSTQQHLQQHPSQHQQAGMTGSPRSKIEPNVPQTQQRPPMMAHVPNGNQMQQQQQQQQQQQNNIPGSGPGGVNPNAAPGPIPATTPLVVRQDNNGVQWIAFEYSRDRVKMEYTIRCDVESVNVDTLSQEFKTENCVYPRACCNKDQYRGNRLVYETECNTVGWALAELNPCLRGKRGLIQRAVDSWRNSNQDPRLRSRRVRRMAKINNRKAVSSPASHQSPHMPGNPNGGGPGIPSSANLGQGGPPSMGTPGMGGMSGQHHHHQGHPDGSAQGGDEVDDQEYDGGERTHHHHQAPNGSPGSHSPDDIRQQHVYSDDFSSYPPPPVNGASIPPRQQDPRDAMHHVNGTSVRGFPKDFGVNGKTDEERKALFGDIPDGKARKFILVDDTQKGQRVRVRVTLDTVDIDEIPDSFRKSNSVYPRSWFPMQMQSPPPSSHGRRFFVEDDGDDVGGGLGRKRGRKMVAVPLQNGAEAEIAVPKMGRAMRSKEVKINELGFRMTWHQSRVFAGKTVFLQKALDSYRNKTRATLEGLNQDVVSKTPHFETRVGKRRWNERASKRARCDDA